jgi:hypothetical protein
MLSTNTQAKIDLYNKKRDGAIQKVLNYYTTIKKRNMYNPAVNNKKYLTIIATHIHNKRKLATLINNARTIDYDCNDIIIINSQGLPFNNQVRAFCDKRNIKYIEIDNIPSLDFGKWLFTLKNNDYSSYNYIVFTNDSYTIHKPMHHFYTFSHLKCPFYIIKYIII